MCIYSCHLWWFLQEWMYIFVSLHDTVLPWRRVILMWVQYRALMKYWQKWGSTLTWCCVDRVGSTMRMIDAERFSPAGVTTCSKRAAAITRHLSAAPLNSADNMTQTVGVFERVILCLKSWSVTCHDDTWDDIARIK